jgi:hypothetical protein
MSKRLSLLLVLALLAGYVTAQSADARIRSARAASNEAMPGVSYHRQPTSIVISHNDSLA